MPANSPFRLPAKSAKAFEPYVGKDVIFGIRPENIHDAEFVPSNIQAAKVAAKVDVTELMGNEILLYLVTGKNTFVARVDPRSKMQVGDKVDVDVRHGQVPRLRRSDGTSHPIASARIQSPHPVDHRCCLEFATSAESAFRRSGCSERRNG